MQSQRSPLGRSRTSEMEERGAGGTRKGWGCQEREGDIYLADFYLFICLLLIDYLTKR